MGDKTKPRRSNWQIVFGEGDERWQIADPCQRRVSDAQRAVRYDDPQHNQGDAIVLASVASDFGYLVHDCPTTKLACEKLAKLRAAVRAIPDPEADGDG